MGLLVYLLPYLLGNVYGQVYMKLVLRYIQEGLVYGNRLYQVGVLMKYVLYLPRHLFIFAEVGAHDDELRAQLLSPCDGHGRVYAEGARLV